ncbi:MAG TPA: hypothetical protein VKN14_11165 [Flavobacteriaceae bacterium]|nr:hypothetical protein [Flavobacteriaceae bacterium]
MNNWINYLFIIIGGIVAFYAQHDEQQNQYILIGGIVLLMIGIYRLAKTIPSKSEKDEDSHNDDLNNG